MALHRPCADNDQGGLIHSWDASTGQFDFQVTVTDSDCNLGNCCLGAIDFWVGGIPGSTVAATLQVLDSVGEISNIWSVASTAN